MHRMYPKEGMAYEEVPVRQELREFIRGAEALFLNDCSMTADEREVLTSYIQTLVEKYLTWFEPSPQHDS